MDLFFLLSNKKVIRELVTHLSHNLHSKCATLYVSNVTGKMIEKIDVYTYKKKTNKNYRILILKCNFYFKQICSLIYSLVLSLLSSASVTS